MVSARRLSPLVLVACAAVTACPAEVGVDAPLAPENLAAIAGNGAVFLSWDDVIGSDGSKARYTLYTSLVEDVDADSAREPDAKSPFVDDEVNNGVRSYYAVTATVDGVESAFSRVESALPDTGATAPGAPQDLRTEGRDDGIVLRFLPDGLALSYTAYRGRDSGVDIDNGEAIVGVENGFVDTTVPEGQTFFYVVTATTADGESPISREASAARGGTGVPPSTPGNVSATAGDGQVTLRFDTVAGASSYRAFFRTSAGVTPANGTALTVTSPFVHAGRANDVEVFYVVTAENDAGSSAASVEVSATPRAGIVAPDAVDDLVAVAGDGQVTLSWTDVPGATSYLAFGSTTPGVTTSSTPFGTVTNPFTASGLTNDATAYFRVAVVSGAGTSALSNEVSATPTSTPAARGSITSSLAAGVIVQFENTLGGGGTVNVQVVNGSPETGTGIDGLTVQVSGAATGGLPGSGGGSYGALTPAPILPGTYTFTIGGAVSGSVVVVVGPMPSCAVTSPAAGTQVPRNTDLPLQWASQNSDQMLVSFEDSDGSVLYPAIGPPDPQGVLVPGTDLTFAGPIDVLLRAAWKVSAGNARGIALGDCGRSFVVQ